MSIEFKLKEIVFSGATNVNIADDSITVVVGPNNSGKSTLLREISQTVKTGTNQTKNSRVVTTEILFKKEGNVEALAEFMSKNTKSFSDNNGYTFYRALGVNENQNNVREWWRGDHGLHGASPLFCFFANTEQRLTAANPASAIDILNDPLIHPIHSLYEDDEIELKFSKYFKSAFGTELIVNRCAGSKIPLHMGKRPRLLPGQHYHSSLYLKELAKLPLVHDQGDGIRSFVGCLLATLVTKRCITLLDEPEAFLHPPQARLLGGLLAREHKDNQLIIATHSGDVLRGLLDSNNESLNILRLVRKDNKNFASKLGASEVKALWSDSVLRFSNILDGLFHEEVILCESDSDCRFYSALMLALYEKNKNEKVPDFFFTSSGGKDRIPLIIRALVKVQVATKVVVDFDVLSDEKKLKEIFESMGGDWELVKSDYNTVKAAVTSKTPPLSSNQVVEKIGIVLKDVDKECVLSESHKDQIKRAMKATSAWSSAKECGTAAVASGAPTTSLIKMLDVFKKNGLFVVPVGELESFDKSVGLHGPKWLAKVLEKDIQNCPELEGARKFVKELASPVLTNTE